MESIKIIATRFLDFAGDEIAPGGLQRYILYLIRFFKEHNRHVTVYQKATGPFDREIADARVVGVKTAPGGFGHLQLNLKTRRLVKPGDKAIYASMETAYPRFIPGAAVIQHGVWWDREFPFAKRIYNSRNVRKAARKASKLICVDTNFINWHRTTYPGDIGFEERAVYIPNCVDTSLFDPEKYETKKDELPVLLFPRRAEIQRGVFLFFDVCESLFAKGRDFRAVFAGEGRASAELETRIGASRFNERYEATSVAPDDMPALYARSDIVVVPTTHGEGTSYAVLEAMAMGKPVVATTVGGLPNLVIHGVNGLLTAPTAPAFKNAVTELLDNPAEIKRLGGAGREISRQFSLPVWLGRIEKTLAGFI